MNVELEKKAKEKAMELCIAKPGSYYHKTGPCDCCQPIFAALLEAYKEGQKEMREKALKKLQELRDSADAWEVGRFSVLSSAALAIRELKEE